MWILSFFKSPANLHESQLRPAAMDQKRSSNKITEIVRLHQILKKWKKLAAAAAAHRKGMSFIKRMPSFSGDVPKGFFAVTVGEEMRRFVIPTEYLSRRAFAALLREAEEEFGFRQEGVLRFPCQVSVYESILEVVEKGGEEGRRHRSSETELTQSFCNLTMKSQGEVCMFQPQTSRGLPPFSHPAHSFQLVSEQEVMIHGLIKMRLLADF